MSFLSIVYLVAIVVTMGLQDFYIAVRELYPQTTTLLKGPRFDGVDKHYDHVFFDMNNALYLLA